MCPTTIVQQYSLQVLPTFEREEVNKYRYPDIHTKGVERERERERERVKAGQGKKLWLMIILLGGLHASDKNGTRVLNILYSYKRKEYRQNSKGFVAYL